MPSLPKPRIGRRLRATQSPELTAQRPDQPHVEIVEAPGLRWINVERPRSVDQAWMEERFDFHPLDYEDVFSRNQRPKVDEYDDYLFIVLHFPRFDKRAGRLNAGEMDVFIGPVPPPLWMRTTATVANAPDACNPVPAGYTVGVMLPTADEPLSPRAQLAQASHRPSPARDAVARAHRPAA